MNAVPFTPAVRRASLFLVLLCALLLPVLAAAAPRSAPALPMLELDVRLDPQTRRFDGEARIALPAGEFRFELIPALQADKAEVDGQALKLRALGNRAGMRSWSVTLAQAGVLSLRYGGELPALDTGLDHRDVLRALPPMASPEGSFLPAGSGWYPQPPGEFGYRVRVSVPGSQRAIVPGRLAEEHLPDAEHDSYRAQFEMRHASRSVELMAGPWVMREKRMAGAGGEPLRLRTLFPAALDAEPGLADAYLADSERYISHYSKLIGAYPYDGFAVVAGPLPTGFGMPAMTYIGEQVLRLPFIRATSLGHEVLHNWWGNAVQVDYASGNWSEGLTTFMADYAYAERESAPKAREMRLGWLRDFAALPASGQMTLAQFRSRTDAAAAATGYGKAAMLFVMLEDRIGKAAFERGIRIFWQRHRFGVAGWKDLQAAFEKSSGTALDDFFRQWLEGSGGPEVTLENPRIVSEGGQRKLAVTVVQGSPALSLRLPLQLLAGEHDETRWVTVSESRQEVRLALGKAGSPLPQAVRLDPELRVWRRPEAAQLPPILRQWIGAAAPRLAVPAPASGDTRQAAVALAGRFFERPAQPIGTAALKQGSAPVLLIGLHAEIDAVLAEVGLPGRPDLDPAATAAASAQVWTVQQSAGPPLAVVSARDAVALNALQRSLPHYGGQSWLVFDGGTLLARGVWPAPGTALAVQQAGAEKAGGAE